MSIRCMWISLLFSLTIPGTTTTLQAYGCMDGWTNFGEHCYTILVGQKDAQSASTACEAHGATAASIWSPEEKNFLIWLWQYAQKDPSLMWTGLISVENGQWQWEDASLLSVTQKDTSEWSILDDADGQVTALAGLCGAITATGSLVSLGCLDDTVQAAACKTALPKVFAWANGQLNRSGPDLKQVASPLDSVMLFERVLPPILTSLPSSLFITQGDEVVRSEPSCAFNCYSVESCRVFELSCQTADNCASYRCQLFADLFD